MARQWLKVFSLAGGKGGKIAASYACDLFRTLGKRGLSRHVTRNRSAVRAGGRSELRWRLFVAGRGAREDWNRRYHNVKKKRPYTC
jgi:hypothetical protein